MKRLKFILNDVGYCKVQVTDLNGPRCFFMDSEEKATEFEIDIFGESFDLTVTPLVPDTLLKDNNETNKIPLKEIIERKVVSSVGNFLKDIFFRVECTYRIENFCDGDTLNINMLIYACPTNDDLHPLWWLSPEFLDMVFPVGYMFYDVLLGKKRIEPKNTVCIDRKKTIKRARKFVIVSSIIFEPIGYPIQMVRIRFLSRERRIFSTLLNFSKMNEEKRWKYIGNEDFYENVT